MSMNHDFRYDLRVEGMALVETMYQFKKAFDESIFGGVLLQDPDDLNLFSTDVAGETASFYAQDVEEGLHKLSVKFPQLTFSLYAEDLDDYRNSYELLFKGDMYQRRDCTTKWTDYNPPVPFEQRQEIRRIEADRDIKIDEMIQNFCRKSDFDLLDAQKYALIGAIEKGTAPPKEAMEGLVNFLDVVCDLGETLGRFKYNDIEPPFPLQADYKKRDIAFKSDAKTTKDKTMALYEQMLATHNDDNKAFYVADYLAYLASHAEPDEGVSLDVLYQLSERVYDVGRDQPLLTHERLNAIKILLEEGIAIDLDERNAADISIPANKVPEFLLTCSEASFIYAVETTAYSQQELFQSALSVDHEKILMNNLLLELKDFIKEKEAPSLDQQIADAQQRKQSAHAGKTIEKEKEI